ncbi:MAG: glycosyltransferase family 4 protein, partial [Opitutales bacterium]|nr:glycosyltransferase family 4 protein [Opitutales bacterium]
HPDNKVRREFRIKHNISEDDFVVIYAGKQVKAKGADFFAETIKPKMERKDGCNIVFMVVGNSPADEYGAHLDKLYASSENRIIRFPTQKYVDLHTYFQAADLAVFPNEGSLTFYDAQACALPVLWSDEKLNVERLQFGNGFNFKLLDKSDFAEKILKCANMPKEEFTKMRENALNYIKCNYDYEKISREYESFIIDEYNRQKSEKNF